jgi:hypothetical protein
VATSKPCEPIYRVWFEGAELHEQALAALERAGAVWEGTLYQPGGARHHHSVRVRATGSGEAIEHISSAIGRLGRYRKHRAEPLIDSAGAPWRGAINRRWEEVDWNAPELTVLRPLQRAVIGALLDDHEPTWTIVKDPEVVATRSDVEAALKALEQAGLVDHRLALGLEPGADTDDPVPWWALTNRAWDLLGLVKSPRYRP